MAVVIFLLLGALVFVIVSLFVLFLKKLYYSLSGLIFLSLLVYIFSARNNGLSIFQWSDNFYELMALFTLFFSFVCFPIILLFDIRKRKKIKQVIQ